VFAAAPGPLVTLRAIHDLSHAEAAKGARVAFEATVTYRRANETSLFVQDGDAGIYVWADAKIGLTPGDRVFIVGKAQDSFRPIVIADTVTVLHPGSLPTPISATFDELTRVQRDCVRVAVHAKVRSADFGLSGDHKDIHLGLLVDGGAIDAYVDLGDASLIDRLLDAEVEVNGVAQLRFDGKMQPTGVALAVPSIDDIKILKPADTNPWSLPPTEMDGILPKYHVNDSSKRVLVHGVITYYIPRSAIVLQSGKKSIWIHTLFEMSLRIGSQADVTGFPDIHDNFLALTDGEIRQTQVYTPIDPQPVTTRQLAASKNIYELVSVEAQVVTSVRESSQDEYVLRSDNQVFSAIYRHPEAAELPPLPMNQIPTGSKVRVTGVSVLGGSNPFGHEVPFNILMRTPDDISVVAPPGLLSVPNLVVAVLVLLLLVLAAGSRGWVMERKVRRQTAALAYIEQRRSRILEDINGARPLAEIIEQITELVSFKLKGAPCWCQIAEGAQLGNCPRKQTAFRIVHEHIPGRSGSVLGTISAALDPLTEPRPIEAEALSMAAALSSLAIETRRIYSDLRHRSEFDLLTDTHNRFSLDKHLASLIEEARLNASIFGLIYIDLDKFKQINDLYGHQVGDRFLQDVAVRMKRQLRPHDLLARLGGDEFAVLVPVVRSRADVEEIAQRLERSMDKPFLIDRFNIKGSASVGVALYPEDGINKDSILNAADAAMYVAKHSARQLD
jgi:diguanylate cyclase (GGDEF)-like protein